MDPEKNQTTEPKPEKSIQFEAPAVAPEPEPKQTQQPQVQYATEEDHVLSGMISEAGKPDMEEWEKIYIGIEKAGNVFDMARAMFPFTLPTECQKMHDAKQRRYGWISKENMETKCDPSRIFYYTPVNRNNHPSLPNTAFNKHGGVYREGLYLCWMPWKMWDKRSEVQKQLADAPWQSAQDRVSREGDGVGHFDPTNGGTKSGMSGSDIVYAEAEPTHPEDIFEEAGDRE